MMLILRWLTVLTLAALAGKMISRLKLPSILGWLIIGMFFGPHALGIVSQNVLDSSWYKVIIIWMQCAFGLMLGTELVWKKMKNYGKGLVVTTLTQSLGTFLLVTIVFGIIFGLIGVPIYLAFVFGSIALATAPASVVSGFASGGSLSLYMIPLMIFLPVIIGIVVGLPAGLLLKKTQGRIQTLAVLIVGITLTVGIGWFVNMKLSGITLNYMLMGVSFSAAFTNIVSEERLKEITDQFHPILAVSLLASIVDLGAPLNYHLILGAGSYTFIYIAARGMGKYFGARLGAKAMKMPDTVQKYLGLTLLPHSGVSLVFTGIACSALAARTELASILQGTIAAAAVITAKKGFELSGEIKTV